MVQTLPRQRAIGIQAQGEIARHVRELKGYIFHIHIELKVGESFLSFAKIKEKTDKSKEKTPFFFRCLDN
jgi:hypothetical protein